MAEPFSLEDFLAQQRADYRASLPGRLQQLEAARAAGAWKETERCAHGIAGSAATFGLAELGDAARVLEEAIEQLHGAQPDPGAREVLAARVETPAAMLRSMT
ncbi:hypothetical protein HK414_27985 [Ramlibacter terrae]|uniref:HPt domain-containing protein n=1 Tax=Ramlibacter terrae TaxID=2732511 RepID=A0ABX6P6H2_9BURK|nr:hypothetical protein HK414_27985 [Ramlibacter terrae]